MKLVHFILKILIYFFFRFFVKLFKNSLPDQSIDLIEPGDPNVEHPIEPTALTNAIPETQSKKCQATLQVPQRTRRIQVSLDKKNMVSTGTQCSSLTDNIPLRVAAGLTPVLQQHAVETEEDNDEGSVEDPDFDLDSEYPESDSSDEEDEEFQLRTDITPL